MLPYSSTPAGWYPDPYRPDLQRYWDGHQWTAHIASMIPPPAYATYPAVPGPVIYDQPYLHGYPEVNVRPQKSWGLGDVVLGFGLFFLISFLLTAAVAVVGVLVNREATSVEDILANDIISVLILLASGIGSAAAFLGVPLYATYRKGQRSLTKDFGLRFTWLDPILAVGMAVAGLIFSVIVTIGAEKIFGEEASNTGGIPTSFSGPEVLFLILTFFVVAIVVPFVEELFFRGLMLRAITKRFSMPAAIISSSIIFGLAHITGASTLAALIAIPAVTGFYGLVFALVTAKTNRLGAAILAHMLINAAAVLALFFAPGV